MNDQGLFRVLVEVDSIVNPDVDLSKYGKKFYIVSAMKNVSDTDLEFKIMARWLARALELQGYQQAADKNDADLIIRFAYGIGEPKTETHQYQTGLGYSYSVGWWQYYVPPPTKIETSTTYPRHLIVSAYDSDDPARATNLWVTKCFSEGTSNDLRKIVPFILTVAKDYFGKQTSTKVEVNIWSDDVRVLDIVVGPLKKQEQSTNVKGSQEHR